MLLYFLKESYCTPEVFQEEAFWLSHRIQTIYRRKLQLMIVDSLPPFEFAGTSFSLTSQLRQVPPFDLYSVSTSVPDQGSLVDDEWRSGTRAPPYTGTPTMKRIRKFLPSPGFKK